MGIAGILRILVICYENIDSKKEDEPLSLRRVQLHWLGQSH